MVKLPEPHARQVEFIDCPAKRKVVRAGRRGGKTVGMSILAVEKFLEGRRILYAAPTAEQLARFWTEVTTALAEPIVRGLYAKNETEHVIELRGTEQRIRAKTAWSADTLRGDYADLLILDEWQLMDEDAWGLVGAPMLLDNNGDAVFVYTPPSLHSRTLSKARDPRHAAKLFERARQDTTGRWAAFTFPSHDNPHISKEALADITTDMTALAYRQEIEAEDVDSAPGALWKRETIEAARVLRAPDLQRVVVGVDPSATATGDAAGIVVAGVARDLVTRMLHLYVLDDKTVQGSPLTWARAALDAYHRHKADRIVAEVNNGGEMVETTLRAVEAEEGRRMNSDSRGRVAYRAVQASRGKAVRAEPVAALYEQGRGHHVGTFGELEDEMCQWQPGEASPNRMDALVWAATDLMLGGGGAAYQY